jgi:hypothetical protein
MRPVPGESDVQHWISAPVWPFLGSRRELAPSACLLLPGRCLLPLYSLAAGTALPSCWRPAGAVLPSCWRRAVQSRATRTCSACARPRPHSAACSPSAPWGGACPSKPRSSSRWNPAASSWSWWQHQRQAEQRAGAACYSVVALFGSQLGKISPQTLLLPRLILLRLYSV